MDTVTNWPPIAVGTVVNTIQPTQSKENGWTEEGLASRQWGVEGEIVGYHDSHGLHYDVKHPDGTLGYYDPTELEVV